MSLSSTTIRNFAAGAFGALVAISAGGCTGEPAAPANPTWVNDVLPILAGNCLHCHGRQAGALGGGSRFDLYDADLAEGFDVSGLSSAKDGQAARISIRADGRDDDGNETPTMPPPPGHALSQWQLDTLFNFRNAEADFPGRT